MDDVTNKDGMSHFVNFVQYRSQKNGFLKRRVPGFPRILKISSQTPGGGGGGSGTQDFKCDADVR